MNPLVAQFSEHRYRGEGTEVVYLPGDAPETETTNGFYGAWGVVTCQACTTEMPREAVDSFDNDGAESYLCLDATACTARIKGLRETPGTHSFVIDAVNRLGERVAELESWRASVVGAGGLVGAPTGAPTNSLDGVVPCTCRAATEGGGHSHGCHATRNAVSPVTRKTLPEDHERVAEILAEMHTIDDLYLQTKDTVMGSIHAVGHTLARGDARMVPMDDASVDLIVTSPPYWAQRSYTDDGGQHYTGQIGDEPTYAQFIDNLVACTRDWVRVLKPSGSIWVNLGDKYSTGGSADSTLSPQANSAKQARGRTQQVPGMRPKSLLGLPWRYALRCMDELGLILREEVIWSKPNGMPESVVDRCRRSHEQWFHFTLRPDYYSAVDRIRLEQVRWQAPAQQNYVSRVRAESEGRGTREVGSNPLGALPPSVWEVATAGLIVPGSLGVDHYAAFPMELPRRIIQGFSPQHVCTVCGEGRRPVKTVMREGGRIRQKLDNRFLGKPGTGADSVPSGSQDAIGAHAGYKTWHRISGEVCACTPYTDHPGVRVGVEARSGDALVPGNVPRSLGAPSQGPWREYHLEDWEPPPATPGVVLDPFGGTGTTVLVAEMHGRHGVHLDLSADYLRLAEWRTNDPVQRASALQVPKPPVEMPDQLALDLFASNE